MLSFIVGGAIVIGQLVTALTASDGGGYTMLPAGSGQIPRFLLLSYVPTSAGFLYALINAVLGAYLVIISELFNRKTI